MRTLIDVLGIITALQKWLEGAEHLGSAV